MARRKQLVFLAGITLCGFGAFDYLMTPTPSVSPRCFHRLRCGMSIDQIETALGRAADHEGRPHHEGMRDYWWHQGNVDIFITMERDGTAWDGRCSVHDPGAPMGVAAAYSLGQPGAVFGWLHRWLPR